MKKAIFTLLIGLLLTSCDFGGKSSKVTHYPFKESKKDKWGLVDAKGKVLVENEFEERPTCVSDGIFFVEGKKGYEMYSVDNPQKPIGDIYKRVALFTDDITPTVKEAEGIKYIDKKGNVKFELPLKYTNATCFENGYSIISEKEDGIYKVGAMSTSGKILSFKHFNIDGTLSDGTFIARKIDDDSKRYVIDKKGDVKLEIDSERVMFSSDNSYYIFYDDEAEKYGVRKRDGDIVVRTKYDKLIFSDDAKHIVFSDDGSWGIMNIKGDVLVKPRYDAIVQCRKDCFIAVKGESFGLLNMKEDKILNFDYDALIFIPGSDNLVAKKQKDESIYIIDKKGKDIAEFSDSGPGLIYHFYFYLSLYDYDLPYKYLNHSYYYYGSAEVESDYFDVADCVKSVLMPQNLTIDNLFGYSGLNPSDCADKQDESYSRDDISKNNCWFPDKELEECDYGDISYSLGFSEVVVTSYDYDDYWESYPRYSYSSKPCLAMIVTLSMNNETSGHSDLIEKKIADVLQEAGYSKKITDDDGNTWYQNQKVRIRYGIDDDELYFVVRDLKLFGFA